MPILAALIYLSHLLPALPAAIRLHREHKACSALRCQQQESVGHGWRQQVCEQRRVGPVVFDL